MEEHCDPATVSVSRYPHKVQALRVMSTNPLKLRAELKIQNSSELFIVEGIVCGGQWNDAASLAACRSIGCSKATWSKDYDYKFSKSCLFECDGLSATRDCSTIIDKVNCPGDAMSLTECLQQPLFQGCSYNGGQIYLACSGC